MADDDDPKRLLREHVAQQRGQATKLVKMADDVAEALGIPGLTEAHAKGICAMCGKLPQGFTDELSVREYRISRLCQACQDDVFCEPEEDDDDQPDDLGPDIGSDRAGAGHHLSGDHDLEVDVASGDRHASDGGDRAGASGGADYAAVRPAGPEAVRLGSMVTCEAKEAVEWVLLQKQDIKF